MKAFAKQPDQSSSSAKKVWVQTAGLPAELLLHDIELLSPHHQSQQKAKGRRKACSDKLSVHKLFQEVQQNLVCFGFHHVPRFCQMLEKP